MNELIVLVNESDEVIGYENKLVAHELGKLHRAFSIFIVDEYKLTVLIQKRALNKYHSGGLWSNACCSHPRKEEELLKAVCRRTKDELGLSIPESDYDSRLWETQKFAYRKDFGRYIEHEIDHVFIWSVDSQTIKVSPNKEEIDDFLWIDIFELMDWMEEKPEDFTAWFFPAFEIFILSVLFNSTMMTVPISSTLYDIIEEKKSDIEII